MSMTPPLPADHRYARMRFFATETRWVNDTPYFFGVQFRRVGCRQPGGSIKQIRVGLIWWHVGVTWEQDRP